MIIETSTQIIMIRRDALPHSTKTFCTAGQSEKGEGPTRGLLRYLEVRKPGLSIIEIGKNPLLAEGLFDVP